MRLPFHVMAVAAAASLAFALPHQVHAASPADQGEELGACTFVAPSIQKCGDEPYYQIEQDGRKVDLFIVDGQVKVHAEGPVTVSLALLPPPEQMPSLPTPAYGDDTVEIATLRDSQQRLSWMVSPVAAPKARHTQLMCTGAGCSVSRILLRIE